MKLTILSIPTSLAIGLAVGGSLSAKASTAVSQEAPTSLIPAVRTNRILAIGHLTPRANLIQMQKTMRPEVRETVKLYLAGTIDSWYMRKDKPGVVFLLNLSDLTEARKVLEGLPLGKEGLMEFELTPLGPLAPLGTLLRDPSEGASR